MFLEQGYMPVISPVGFGKDGSSYNINADVAAGEIAAACGAERLIFLTDVAGILDDEGSLISEIRAAELEAKLGASIKGGMHVKVQAVLARAGERRARRPRRRRAPAPQRRRRAVHRPGRRHAGDLTMRIDELRRDAIRDILANGSGNGNGNGRAAIASQAELRRRLRARGINASQATLSRDLAALGVHRAAGARGPRYVVDGDGGVLPLEPVRRLVDGIESNAALVVVRTKASAASTVARALDEAQLDEVMGTIAGDDTIFVAPRRPGAGNAVARRLRAVLGLDYSRAPAAPERLSPAQVRSVAQKPRPAVRISALTAPAARSD